MGIQGNEPESFFFFLFTFFKSKNCVLGVKKKISHQKHFRVKSWESREINLSPFFSLLLRIKIAFKRLKNIASKVF